VFIQYVTNRGITRSPYKSYNFLFILKTALTDEEAFFTSNFAIDEISFGMALGFLLAFVLNLEEQQHGAAGCGCCCSFCSSFNNPNFTMAMLKYPDLSVQFKTLKNLLS